MYTFEVTPGSLERSHGKPGYATLQNTKQVHGKQPGFAYTRAHFRGIASTHLLDGLRTAAIPRNLSSTMLLSTHRGLGVTCVYASNKSRCDFALAGERLGLACLRCRSCRCETLLGRCMLALLLLLGLPLHEFTLAVWVPLIRRHTVLRVVVPVVWSGLRVYGRGNVLSPPPQVVCSVRVRGRACPRAHLGPFAAVRTVCMRGVGHGELVRCKFPRTSSHVTGGSVDERAHD